MMTLIYADMPELRPVVMAMAADYGAVVGAVVADFVSGVSKARRAGVARTSRGYRRTVEKLSSYLTALCGLSVVDAVLMAAAACISGTGGPAIPLLPGMTTLGALGLVLIEVRSICERAETKDEFARAASAVERLVHLLSSFSTPKH